MPWTGEEKNWRLFSYLGTKIIQNGFKIDPTQLYDNDLSLRQETQKKITCPGSWYNNN